MSSGRDNSTIKKNKTTWNKRSEENMKIWTLIPKYEYMYEDSEFNIYDLV